jgi:pilus assembly protein CpaE
MGMPDSLFDPEPLQTEAAECIAFVGDEQTHSVVSSVLQQFFADAVVRDGDSSAALAYLAEVPAPKIVIVDIGETNQPLSAMLSLTAAFTDDTQMIGIGEINDIALYRELTEAGVTDYLVKPVSEKALAAAISRSEEKSKVEAAPTPQASPEEVHKVVVVGARGGVGASTTAVNLAWIFAEEKGMKTALVDLDLEFGTIALSLDLEPTRGLREALETPARIDNLFISSATAKLSDNLSIMATEENLAHGHSFSPNAVGVLFETLAHENGCIIVDLPRALYSVRDQVLNEATRVILVTELSLPALRDPPARHHRRGGAQDADHRGGEPLQGRPASHGPRRIPEGLRPQGRSHDHRRVQGIQRRSQLRKAGRQPVRPQQGSQEPEVGRRHRQ